MNSQTVYGCDRRKLIVKAAGIIAIFAVAAFLSHHWELLATSALGRLSETTGIPLVPVAIAGIGIMIAYMVVHDEWTFQAVFTDEYLEIKDMLGSIRFHYQNISDVRIVASTSVGIDVYDIEQLMQTHVGSSDQKNKIWKSTVAIRRVCGYPFCISSAKFGVSAGEIVGIVEQKIHVGPKGAALDMGQG